MITEPAYIKSLLQKYLGGVATEEEARMLKLIWSLYDDEELAQLIAQAEQNLSSQYEVSATDWKAYARTIVEQSNLVKVKRNWRRIERIGITIAASILLCIVLAVLITKWNQPPAPEILCGTRPSLQEIPTREFSCTVVLPDSNKTYKIDSTVTGNISKSGNLELRQNDKGVLEFRRIESLATTNEVRLIVYTPASEQYQVILPDGSKLRLNSATKIEFASSFGISNREISVEGEAYMELFNDAKLPLTIKTPNAVLRGSGGDLNINTNYRRTVTSLLNGESFQVHDTARNKMVMVQGDISYVLKLASGHGQSKDTIAIDSGMDIGQLLVWKNLDRVYTNVPLDEFVLELCSWYGLKLNEVKCLPKKPISATICYKASLQEALSVLRKNGLTVYLQGENISFCDPGNKRLLGNFVKTSPITLPVF